MADNYFCLDIGEKHTKVVDGKKIGDIFEVSNLGKIDTGEYFYATELEKNLENQASSISNLVSSSKITKKNVNVVISDSLTYSQILTMPYLNEKELISAIKYQADQFIPMPIEETNIDLEIIEEYKAEKKILILIVAAPKKLIEKIQTTVELAGLIPESVETELSANSRFISNFYKNYRSTNQGNFLLANFSFNSSNLSYFENAIPILKENHNLSLGYQLFLKEIQVNTDTDSKKAVEILKNYFIDHPSSYPVETIISPLLHEFVVEIKKFIDNRKLSNLYLINNISYFPALTKLLEKLISIPTSIINPLSSIKKTPLVEGQSLELPLFVSTIGGNLR
ncbi:MAG: Type IV pilus biogenesis protein PilM [Candidatus Roizmanbacteria bacterium GW2011_GWC2_37_13]|uniref:Type IV pilus biogenesis protein PilM n=1 Tax=Candidatus Roizmanbacteria bacterium GW2011_GWC2_37_13 TaxID=1618486 RepID=A0A0G0GHX8_9BACT|nr:MAG: Type IV pilus biogenesis protein PilM [Candidatus Roizmanbacteria bacterium GW2011_GWC1_37_12]KKQ25695.1 MAG: Type IV pilus biogenesis protein PilM [Candidatus Roizmanbacteria bacterium GW2011_GWC2_37_13]